MKNISIICAILLAMTACSTAKKDSMAAEKDKAMSNAKTEMKKAEKSAGSATSAATAEMTSNCTLDKDTRVIEVRKTESGGCELFYTKFGEEKSVASSGFGTQYCEEVKDRISSNLAKAGFTCK